MKKKLYYVERQVVEERAHNDESYQDNKSKSLAEFRQTQRYVLLGEPGAGKTRAFEHEAQILHGCNIPASDFIDLDKAEWRDKVLFIDGLDEVIANAGDRTPLGQIRAKLHQLNVQRYRISCRAADWHGERDHGHLERASGEIAVLQLQGLAVEDIKIILHNDARVKDAESFYQQAEVNQLGDFLSNPQTLDMVIEATTGGEVWPNTKQEIYQKACEVLSKEHNLAHSEGSASRFITEELLCAAGELYSYMLIANGQAFSTDEADGKGVVSLPKLGIKKGQPHYAVLKTRLFNTISNTYFCSIHRSVAEFLAAHYLAKKIKEGLSLRRCFALITGFDGGPVAALRGLYAWLGAFSSEARAKVIATDVLGLVQYGDISQFSVADKKQVIKALKFESSKLDYLNYREDRGLAGIISADIIPELKVLLGTKDYTKPHQAILTAILDGLRHSEPQYDLKDFILSIVVDENNMHEVRWRALDVLIDFNEVGALLALTEDIRNNRVRDDSDELMGQLLKKLFPEHIPASKVFSYLKTVSKSGGINVYRLFWEYDFLSLLKEKDIPELLDILAKMDVNHLYYGQHGSLSRMVGGLVTKGLKRYGSAIDAERLYSWLRIGVDEEKGDIYGYGYDSEDNKNQIRLWLENNPEVYKRILKVCLSKIDDPQNFNLVFDCFWGARSPKDIGLWWLDEALVVANSAIKEECLWTAYQAIKNEYGDIGIEEKLIPWLGLHPEFQPVYERLTTPPEYIKKHEERRLKWKEKADSELKSRLNYFEEHMSALLNGTAPPYALHHLASAYFDHYANVSGQTGVERLSNFLDGNQELIQAAITGISKTLERNDLPTEDEVFKLSTKGKINYLQLPFLTAIEKRYTECSDFFEMVSDEIAQRALAYWWSYGAGHQPAWVEALMLQRPELSSRVLINYMTIMLQKRVANIHGYYQLANDDKYVEIAKRVVMPVLNKYPAKSLASHAAFLEALLKMAISHVDKSVFFKFITQKLKRSSLDVLQKIYLIAAGLVISPEKFESIVQAEVMTAERVNHLSGFLYDGWRSSYQPMDLKASTIELLITLIAPLTTPDWASKGGFVTKSMHDGDFVQTLITRLSNKPEKEVGQVFERLLKKSELSRWHATLKSAQQTYIHNRREAEYRHPSAKDVVETVNQNRPANVADLAAMVLDYLEVMQRDMHTTETDNYLRFWNEDSDSKPERPKVENSCRRYLAEKIKDKYTYQGIEINSEALAANNKRTDIRLIYRYNEKRFNLPIEIKRNSNDEIWTAICQQLIAKYTTEPDTQGRGIYLVVWFGAEYNVTAKDGGSRPKSASELQTRLIATMTPDEKKLIDVFVLDVSKPN